MPEAPVSISHPTDRANFTTVRVGDLDLWFSYRTCIAFQKTGERRVVRVNDWSSTTGKHLAYIDGGKAGSASERIPGDEFETLLAAAVSGVSA